jgi:hypothetical protein
MAGKLYVAALSVATVFAANLFEGRWAMQASDGRVFWLEIKGDRNPEGTFYGATGGRLAKLLDVHVSNGELRFRVERVFDSSRVVRSATTVRATAGGIEGTTTIDEKTWRWTGWRSPEIKDRDDGSWRKGEPVHLLREGMPDLCARDRGRESEWSLEKGVLRNRIPKADLLMTKHPFWNFELHVEYKLPKNGNSGIGLRNHYELQLADDYGQPPDVHGNVSLYSRIRPHVNASKPPGEWQTVNLRLVGRELTATLNGVKVIDGQIIEGLCGLALDPHEERPGPIALQGDHGPVEFRNVIVTPLVRP